MLRQPVELVPLWEAGIGDALPVVEVPQEGDIAVIEALGLRPAPSSPARDGHPRRAHHALPGCRRRARAEGVAAVSKTLGAILQAGLTIASAIPGPQQPFIAAAAVAVSVGNAIIFAPKAPRSDQVETSIKMPIPPAVAGYGVGRLNMAFSLYVTAPDGTAIDVGAFHQDRADAIIGHYLGDTRVTVLPDGRVQAGKDGQFGEKSDIVKIFTTLGPRNNTAFSAVIAKIPDQFTPNHRGDGVVTGAVLSAPVKTKNYQMIYPTGGPNNMPLSLVMRMQLVFDWRDPAQVLTDPLTWKWSESALCTSCTTS